VQQGGHLNTEGRTWKTGRVVGGSSREYRGGEAARRHLAPRMGCIAGEGTWIPKGGGAVVFLEVCSLDTGRGVTDGQWEQIMGRAAREVPEYRRGVAGYGVHLESVNPRTTRVVGGAGYAYTHIYIDIHLARANIVGVAVAVGRRGRAIRAGRTRRCGVVVVIAGKEGARSFTEPPKMYLRRRRGGWGWGVWGWGGVG